MKQLLNDTFMEEWLSNELKTIKSLFADGINLDPEAPIAKDSKEAAALTKWTKAAVDLFHHEIPGSQVTSHNVFSPPFKRGETQILKISKRGGGT